MAAAILKLVSTSMMIFHLTAVPLFKGEILKFFILDYNFLSCVGFYVLDSYFLPQKRYVLLLVIASSIFNWI